jgi:hypothetical protein
VISASGNYFLDNDLNCNGASFGIGIVEKNVDLDLKGHLIFNNDTYVGTGIGTGVAPFSTSSCVAATGVHIHGGAVAGFSVGIALCTPNGARVSLNALVERMYVVDNLTGVSIYGSNTSNRVEAGNISKNFTGVYLGGPSTSGNDIGDILVSQNAQGIYVDTGSGSNNIHNNAVILSTGAGALHVLGNNNIVQSNFLDANTGPGIEVHALASGNKITQNNIVYNTVDAVDDNGFCGINTWQNNFMGSLGSPPCLQ